MPNSIYQATFAGGELAPAGYGRVDLARYQNSLKTCRNFIVRVMGGVYNRPGTGFVCELRDSLKQGRLITFQYSTEQGYCLQFEENWLRVVKDGGQVLSGAGPAVFETAAPYDEDELSEVKFTQSADVMTLTHGDVHTKQLSRTDHDEWTFTDFDHKEGPFRDLNTEKTHGVSVSAQTGTVTVNFSHGLFNDVALSEYAGVLIYIEMKNFGTPWEVAKAVSAGDIRRREGRYYKAVNSATTGTLGPTNLTPGDVESDGAVKWEMIHNGYGILEIISVSDAYTAQATVLSYELPVEITAGATLAITGVADNGSGLYRITSVGHGLASNETVLVYGVYTELFLPGGGSIRLDLSCNGLWVVTVISADDFDLKGSTYASGYVSGGSVAAPSASGVTEAGSYKWALGAWGADQGFPGAVTYFQQRHAFGLGQKLFLSGSGSFDFFGKSTPLRDDDAVNLQLVSNSVNAIRHLIGLDRRLVAFTAGGKFVLPDDDNSPVITPSQKSARPQGSIGSSHVPPALIEDSILYVADNGQAVYEVSYDFASNSYSGHDLSVIASHLLEGHQVVDAAYQHTPFRTYWIVRDDGVLVGLSYLKEHQVSGWHRHDTDGYFERVCVVKEPPEDAVYFIVRRTIEGMTKRYVERLKSRLYTDQRDAVFLDSSLTYDGRSDGTISITLTSSGATWEYNSGEVFTVTASDTLFDSGWVDDEIHFTAEDGTILRMTVTSATTPTVAIVTLNRDAQAEFQGVPVSDWGRAKSTFGGLDHLEGKSVSILADAQEHPARTVDNGEVTLQAAAVVVHAGLPITADFETLDMNVIGGETVRDKQKIVDRVTLVVEASKGILAGESFDADDLLEYKQRNDEGYDEPVELLTGQAAINISSTWGTGGRVCVRQSSPLPLAILAAIPRVTIGGS